MTQTILKGWPKEQTVRGRPYESQRKRSFLLLSLLVLSTSLRLHGLQHSRLPCPLPSLELAQTHVYWVGDAIQPSHPLCCPLLLLPSIFPSFKVFSNESALHIRWPKYWTFIFSISLSTEYAGLISFRMEWLDLLAVQGTLKSLLKHHSSKASVLQCSTFFMVHFSYPYMILEKP